MDSESDDPRLPDALHDELSNLYRASITPSSDRDRFVLSYARAQLARRDRNRRLLRIGGIAVNAAAVAAVLAVVVWVLVPQRSVTRRPIATAVQRTVGDTNNDGIVDVRDALFLARAVESRSAAVTSQTDVNGDKVVDRKDVDAIAMMVVKIEGGTVR